MADIEDDPWASLRESSKREPEAGQFAYNDDPPPAADVGPWEWIKLWFFVDFLGWVRKQFPLASQTLDSTYYLGFTWKKKVATNALKKVIGREGEQEQTRSPLVIYGRRVGVPGFFCIILILCVVIHLTRVLFNI